MYNGDGVKACFCLFSSYPQLTNKGKFLRPMSGHLV